MVIINAGGHARQITSSDVFSGIPTSLLISLSRRKVRKFIKDEKNSEKEINEVKEIVDQGNEDKEVEVIKKLTEDLDEESEYLTVNEIRTLLKVIFREEKDILSINKNLGSIKELKQESEDLIKNNKDLKDLYEEFFKLLQFFLNECEEFNKKSLSYLDSLLGDVLKNKELLRDKRVFLDSKILDKITLRKDENKIKKEVKNESHFEKRIVKLLKQWAIEAKNGSNLKIILQKLNQEIKEVTLNLKEESEHFEHAFKIFIVYLLKIRSKYYSLDEFIDHLVELGFNKTKANNIKNNLKKSYENDNEEIIYDLQILRFIENIWKDIKNGQDKIENIITKRVA